MANLTAKQLQNNPHMALCDGPVVSWKCTWPPVRCLGVCEWQLGAWQRRWVVGRGHVIHISLRETATPKWSSHMRHVQALCHLHQHIWISTAFLATPLSHSVHGSGLWFPHLCRMAPRIPMRMVSLAKHHRFMPSSGERPAGCIRQHGSHPCCLVRSCRS